MYEDDRATRVIFEYSDYVLIFKGKTLEDWDNMVRAAFYDYCEENKNNKHYNFRNIDKHYKFNYRNVDKLKFNNVVNDDRKPYRVVFIYETHIDELHGYDARRYNCFINNILFDLETNSNIIFPLIKPIKRNKLPYNLLSWFDIFNLFQCN